MTEWPQVTVVDRYATHSSLGQTGPYTQPPNPSKPFDIDCICNLPSHLTNIKSRPLLPLLLLGCWSEPDAPCADRQTTRTPRIQTPPLSLHYSAACTPQPCRCSTPTSSRSLSAPPPSPTFRTSNPTMSHPPSSSHPQLCPAQDLHQCPPSKPRHYQPDP
jgi:hypothetical protein